MSNLYTFKFIGGPIDDPSNANALFQELGKATAAWARLEQHVEAILLHVNKKAFSKKLFKKHPMQFKSKLEILTPWFTEHQALFEYKEPMLEIVPKLRELADERNIYVHSILEHFDVQSKTVVFHRIIPKKKDVFNSQRNEVPLEQITAFIDVVNHTNRYLNELSQRIFTPEAVKQLEET